MRSGDWVAVSFAVEKREGDSSTFRRDFCRKSSKVSLKECERISRDNQANITYFRLLKLFLRLLLLRVSDLVEERRNLSVLYSIFSWGCRGTD